MESFGFSAETMEGFRREALDYKFILMTHLRRISHLMASIKLPGNDEVFYFAVVGFEAFLAPYLDRDFYAAKTQLLEAYKKVRKSNNVLIRPEVFGHAFANLFPTWHFGSSVRSKQSQISYAMILLALLQDLCARKGLLLERETVTSVKRRSNE